MRLVFSHRGPATVVMALVATLLLGAPAAAQDRAAVAADKALERAQDLASGQGVRTGRELTLALADVANRRSALSSSEREEADDLLSRPTDPADTGQPGGPYTVPDETSCTARFCVHWVTSTDDAPDLTDASGNGLPDYIDLMKAAFEQSYAVENGQLRWRDPVQDAGLDGNSLLDVYVKEIGDFGYGYAATDPGQSSRTRHGFQVMDDDYSAEDFPDYGGDPTIPVRVTAAHEYNHILQYAYDRAQDKWMFESTATWAEDKVFDADNDWYLYMPKWAMRPTEPLTAGGSDSKLYGSAIWNHWIDRRCGASVVRRAWDVSIANSVEGVGFAPGSYNAAIREFSGNASSFAREFGDFAAATAEWKLADSGIREGAAFPDVAPRSVLSYSASTTSITVNHTAYVLRGLNLSTAPGVRFTGTLPVGTSGSLALVGRGTDGTTVAKVVRFLPEGGAATVVLADPARFDRLTAVIVNSSTTHDGFGTSDWAWNPASRSVPVSATQLTSLSTAERDAALTAENAPEVACSNPDPDQDPNPTPIPTPSPSPSPSPTPQPTATPTVTPPARTSVKLSRSTTRIGSAVRRGIQFLASISKPGRLSATASVDRRTAKRLGLGNRRTVGKGARTARTAGKLRVNVKLTKRARAGLKRQQRTLRISVTTRFVPADGTRAVRRTISLLLRPAVN